MLNHKRYKQLKKRRKQLIIMTRYSKIQIRYSSRIRDFATLRRTSDIYAKQKREINYITEILRMHKILWKQHLVSNV